MVVDYFVLSYFWFLCGLAMYMYSSMPWQLMWNHLPQLSQQTAWCFHVHALLHNPHGYFGGPGFGSGAYEFVKRMLQRYVNTSLSYLISLLFFDVSIIEVGMIESFVLWSEIVIDHDLSGALLFTLMYLSLLTALHLTVISRLAHFASTVVIIMVVSTAFIVFMVSKTVWTVLKTVGS